MLISVLITTIRSGCLEWQIENLYRQTIQPTEILISDGYYSERHELISSLSKRLDMNVIHLPEPDIGYPSHPIHARSRNQLLEKASGEMVIFLDDWQVLPDDFIEKHIKLHRIGYSSIPRWLHTRHMNPCPYDEFVKKLVPVDRDYIIERMKHKTIMGGRNRDLSEEQITKAMKPFQEDHRIVELSKERPIAPNSIILDVPYNWYWTNCVSAPLDKVLEVNGFDETYHGGSGLDDVDLGARLYRAGVKFAIDTSCTVYHIDHAHPNITTRQHPYNICEYHDRQELQGNNKVGQFGKLKVWFEEGVRRCKCNECGWEGLANSEELFIRHEREQLRVAPTYSFGRERSDIRRKNPKC